MKSNCPALRFGRILIAGVALASLPAQAQMAQPAETSVGSQPASQLASISGVLVSGSAERTTVLIKGSRPLHYRTSRLENPARLVLDFAGTQVVMARNTVQGGTSPVRTIRAGQSAPEQSRIVIDLDRDVPYTVLAEGSNVSVTFEALSAAQPSQKAHEVAAHDAPKMPLPAWITGNSALARPAAQPPAPSPQAAPQGVAQRNAARGPYSGDPISVNLKDVDLKDFFRLIHEISGLNIVLDPSVKGNVTLVLDEVPWDQALDIVLRNNGLSKEIDGNVLRVATQDTLKHEADSKRELAKAQQDAVEAVTTTRVLSYAKADAIKDTVKRFLSARGDVLADPRSNTLIISDIPESMPKIDNLLRQLDRKSQQVEIDARVVAASRSFARDIGTQFGFSTPAGNTAIGGLVGIPGALSTIVHSNLPPFIPFNASSGATIPLSSNLPASTPSSGFTFTTQGRNYAIDFLLTAMENRGIGKLLSEPKGITQNNEKLTVKQGTKIPIQTTINNTVSVQYIDAVLKLEVTPQITADGTVFMEVLVENTQIDQGIPRVQGIPALDTQSTETKVLINDGGTVVIGGVVITSQRTDINQVPLVGSIPIIGHLFKRTSVNVQSQELMFFVTPRIIPG